jgi:hypothetical protein
MVKGLVDEQRAYEGVILLQTESSTPANGKLNQEVADQANWGL